MSKPTPPAKPSRLGRGLSSLMGSPIIVPNQPGTGPGPALGNTTPGNPRVEPAGSPADKDRSTWNAAPLPSSEATPVVIPGALPTPEADGQFARLPLHLIAPNPNQPRRSFDTATLQELAASIKAMGVVQPIIVRRLAPGENNTKSLLSNTYNKSNAPPQAGSERSARSEGPGSAVVSEPPVATEPPAQNPQFQIIAGERRWRAAQLAGVDSIPVIIRKPTAREAAEWALIENLQREDLNPIDRANAFRALIQQHNLSPEALAAVVGQDRSSISNTLRLLDLAPEVQDLVRQNKLTFGQARTLLTLANPIQQTDIAHRAVKGDWSVRALEQHVRALQQALNAGTPPPKPPPTARELHVRDLEANLGKFLGTKVQITLSRKKGAGTLAINFHSLDHFESLLQSLGVKGSIEP